MGSRGDFRCFARNPSYNRERWRSAKPSSLGLNDKSSDTPEGRDPLAYYPNICIGEILTLRLGGRSYRSVVQFSDGSPVPRLSRVKIARGIPPGTGPLHLDVTPRAPVFFWSAVPRWTHRPILVRRVYDKLMVFRGSSLTGLTQIQIGNCLVIIYDYSRFEFSIDRLIIVSLIHNYSNSELEQFIDFPKIFCKIKRLLQILLEYNKSGQAVH